MITAEMTPLARVKDALDRQVPPDRDDLYAVVLDAERYNAAPQKTTSGGVESRHATASEDRTRVGKALPLTADALSTTGQPDAYRAGVAPGPLTHSPAAAHDEVEQMALPDNIRIPLHELWADAEYLMGRVAADGSLAGQMARVVKNKVNTVEIGVRKLMAENAKLREALQTAVPQLSADAILGPIRLTRDDQQVFNRALFRSAKRISAAPDAAPDEVEQMATYLLRNQLPDAATMLRKLKAENAKLREALQTLYDEDMSYITINNLCGAENNYCMVLARNALKEAGK